MSSARRLFGLAFALALVGAAAVPGVAGAAQHYRFKFSDKLHADWQWPPDDGGDRARQAFEILRGKGCGTSPGHALWRVVYWTPASGLSPTTLKFDLVHRLKNPVRVADAEYGVPSTAGVEGYLRFGPTKVTLSAVPHGDVAGLAVDPSAAKLVKRRVRRC